MKPVSTNSYRIFIVTSFLYVLFSFVSVSADAQKVVPLQSDRQAQVLINFLTNACKFTSKGSITLDYGFEKPGTVTFSVTDTGSDIPDDKADVIFRRFAKLDKFKQGSGLGLHICALIAKGLHAEVKLDTSYRGGARFLFIHPINQN